MAEDQTAAARRSNRALAWRAVEAARLAEQPACERCGQPAVEAHNRGGDCCVSGPYSLDGAEALCRRCHRETGCTTYRVTATDRLLARLL
jgi:hypothetical protein